MSTIYRPTSGRAQETINRHVSRSTLDRLSTDCRSISRSSVDRVVLIDCRSRYCSSIHQDVDRVSIEMSIDTRPRMPLVHVIQIIFCLMLLLPVSVCLCACFLTWGCMHKLNKICRVIIVSKLYFLRSLQLE